MVSVSKERYDQFISAVFDVPIMSLLMLSVDCTDMLEDVVKIFLALLQCCLQPAEP